MDDLRRDGEDMSKLTPWERLAMSARDTLEDAARREQARAEAVEAARAEAAAEAEAAAAAAKASLLRCYPRPRCPLRRALAGDVTEGEGR